MRTHSLYDDLELTRVRSWVPTPAAAAAATIPQPCDWTREELLNNDESLYALEHGTFPTGGFIAAHHHDQNFLGRDWDNDAQPPPGSFTIARNAKYDDGKPLGAWRCLKPHACGDYYMPSNRSSCESCGQSRIEKEYPIMTWDLPYGKTTGKRVSYVLFRKDTGWVPGYTKNKLWDESRVVPRESKHKTYFPSRMCAFVKAQFPSLSVEDLRPYWSRPLVIEDFDEAERLLNIIKRQKGGSCVGDGIFMEFEGEQLAFVIDDDEE